VVNESWIRELQMRVKDEILSELSRCASNRHIPQGSSTEWTGNSLGLIRAGSLSVEFGEKETLVLTEGSVLGPWIGLCNSLVVVARDESCDLVEYNERELQKLLVANPARAILWTSFINSVAASYLEMFAEVKASAVPPTPRYRSYVPGEVIVRQGELSDEVLYLVDGAAEVIVDNVKVGEIHRDELFGAIAALTGAARTATVVAVQPTVCMVFCKEDFQDLLRSHTGLMTKLIEDMARAMQDLNDTVVHIGQSIGRPSL